MPTWIRLLADQEIAEVGERVSTTIGYSSDRSPRLMKRCDPGPGSKPIRAQPRFRVDSTLSGASCIDTLLRTRGRPSAVNRSGL